MNHELRLTVTLRLVDGEGNRCFGPGVVSLLEGVRQHRSLRGAAGAMGMAYSKAWRIVRRAEEALGYRLLLSAAGGAGGGGASLTPEAERLLTVYGDCASQAEQFCRERLAEGLGLSGPKEG